LPVPPSAKLHPHTRMYARTRTQGLWTRCDKCGVILYIKHLRESAHICFGCGHHLRMSAQERIDSMIDAGEDACCACCVCVTHSARAHVCVCVCVHALRSGPARLLGCM
jgi:acetyl-CoA carboxylase beta subunit